MKTIEYKRGFLEYFKNYGFLHLDAVISLESQIDCYGYSENPEDDAQESIYTLIGCPG